MGNYTIISAHLLYFFFMYNLPGLLVHFGLLPASPQLQRPIRHAFLLLLDLCHASHSFNVQSTTVSCSFWTSACFPTALMSNPTRFLTPFGPLPASPQLQRPIHHGFLLLLDFCHASRSFNVQSTTISCSFWTSAMPPAASTSNPSRFLAPFGLLPCLPQLQHPIRHAFLLLLDFHMLPAALMSNPPRFLAPFGFLPCFPQLQRPIRHAFLLLLDLSLLHRSFNIQSVTLSCSFWTSACFPAASTSNPTRIQSTLASPQPQATHNAKKQHQHIRASIALYLLILF